MPLAEALQRRRSAREFAVAPLSPAELSQLVAAVYARTGVKYGARAERYATLEAGHAVQNLLLTAVALELAAVPAGAFDDERVASALDLPDDESPLYLVAVGRPGR